MLWLFQQLLLLRFAHKKRLRGHPRGNTPAEFCQAARQRAYVIVLASPGVEHAQPAGGALLGKFPEMPVGNTTIDELSKSDNAFLIKPALLHK
jgi:hypothetical protein